MVAAAAAALAAGCLPALWGLPEAAWRPLSRLVPWSTPSCHTQLAHQPVLPPSRPPPAPPRPLPCRTLAELNLPQACREVVDKGTDAVLDEIETAILMVAASVLRGEGFTYTLPNRSRGNQLYVPGGWPAGLGFGLRRTGRA